MTQLVHMRRCSSGAVNSRGGAGREGKKGTAETNNTRVTRWRDGLVAGGMRGWWAGSGWVASVMEQEEGDGRL